MRASTLCPLNVTADLVETQRLAGGGSQLQLHQVEPGDGLGDGVLHLQAGVHLQEEEFAGAGIDDELHGAGVVVTDAMGERHRCVMQSVAGGDIQIGRRRLLQQLLVAALGGAVAGAEMDDRAVPVADDLHLHVTGTLDVALHQHPVIAERAQCLGAGLSQRSVEPVSRADDADALAAPAR